MNAPKGAPFSTVNAWNALHHWNAVRVEISLDRIVVKVPSSNRLPVVLMCVVCSGPKVVNDVESKRTPVCINSYDFFSFLWFS